MNNRVLPLLVLTIASLAHAQTASAPSTSAPSTTHAASRPAFTLGKDTTRITSPLLPDGRPDYVTYIDQTLSNGVTPENNVVVGLLEVVGTGENVISPRFHDEALRRLGIKRDLTASFQGFGEYLKKQRIQYDAVKQDEEDQARKHPWGAKQFDDIARWLTDNDQALDRIAKAADRDRFYWPLIVAAGREDRAPMINALLPSLGWMRNAANALTTRAMLRLDKGQLKECQTDLLAVHRLGRLVSQGPTVIERLVAIAIENLASHGDVQLVAGIEPKAAKEYLAELAKMPPMGNMVTAFDVWERFTTLDTVLSMRKYCGGVLGGVIGEETFPKIDAAKVDWDQVLMRVNNIYDRMVATMRKPLGERRNETNALDKEVVRLKTAAMTASDPTEQAADMLIAILLPSLSNACTLANRCQEHSDLAILAVALAAYHGDKNAYPDKLDDLAPNYLKTIPKDIFSGDPLKYRKEGEGYLLYSIGPNLKDDGGVPGKDDNTGDLAVRLSK